MGKGGSVSDHGQLVCCERRDWIRHKGQGPNLADEVADERGAASKQSHSLPAALSPLKDSLIDQTGIAKALPFYSCFIARHRIAAETSIGSRGKLGACLGFERSGGSMAGQRRANRQVVSEANRSVWLSLPVPAFVQGHASDWAGRVSMMSHQ